MGLIIIEKEVKKHGSKNNECGVVYLPKGLIGQRIRFIINVRNMKRPFKYIKGLVSRL